jgi:hypothetical protein
METVVPPLSERFHPRALVLEDMDGLGELTGFSGLAAESSV